MTTYDTGTASGARGTAGPFEGKHVYRRISWGALIAGVVITVTGELLLGLLGAGIGLGTASAVSATASSAKGLGLGAGIWWIVSSCVSLFAGGYVAAWMAGVEMRFDGVLHGLVTWGIATLATVYLLTSAVGGMLGGGFSALQSVVSTAGSGISSAAQPVADAAGVTPDAIQQQVQAFLQPAGDDPATMTPQQAQKAVVSDLVTYEKGGPDAPAAKARIVDITAAQLKISRPDAEKKVDDAEARAKQALAKARTDAANAAEAAASAASKTAFAGFVVLLLGLGSAGLGGSLAVRRRRRHDGLAA